MSRQLTPDQNKENLDLGRWLHQHSYERDRHEINLGAIKIDLMRRNRGCTVVGEIKKSSKAIESARLQLKFYLYELKSKYGLEQTGVLLFPEEKKKEEVELDHEAVQEVEETIERIKQIQQNQAPPPPKQVKWCRNCAYAEFCWS